MTREKLLDRYQQHVKGCPSCQNGLRLLQQSQVVLKLASAGGFLSLAAVLGQGNFQLVSASSAAAAAGIAAMLWLSALLCKAESKFTYADYVHAKR